MANSVLARALKDLLARGVVVGPREQWYNGNHPVPEASSEAWKKSYGARYRNIRDNQCELVCNARADAVRPTNFLPVDENDPLNVMLAQTVSDMVDANGSTIDTFLRTWFWSGEQTSLLIDFDSAGNVTWFTVDPRNCWVLQDMAGTYQTAVHLWQNYGEKLHATIYTPDFIQVWRSDSDNLVPTDNTFKMVDEYPNRFKDVPFVALPARTSLIDTIKPQNDLLNKSLQTQAVAGEAYVLPFRVWSGFDTYDATSGEVRKLLPQLNPATGSRDVSVPLAVDSEGNAQKVEQFTSPSPAMFLEEQDNLRAGIARLGAVPAFTLQIGGTPPSGDALEQTYLPHIAAKTGDERVIRSEMDRLAALTAKRIIYKKTGFVVDPPPMRIVFSTVSTSTLTTRVDHMVKAVAAGMTLADALVEFLGWSADAAAAAADNAILQAQDNAVNAAAAFSQGVIGA